jgi:hypothetical protein
MQDVRPSNAAECGVKGDQAGLQQTETATNSASQQDSTTCRHNCATFRYLRTLQIRKSKRGSKQTRRHMWSDLKLFSLSRNPLTWNEYSLVRWQLRRASGTLRVFTSDRPHTHTSEATMTAWGFYSSGFDKLGLVRSGTVSGSRRFGNDLVFIVRTHQYSAAVIRRQLLCHQCITDNINNSLQARKFSSYESVGWFRLWALGGHKRQYSLRDWSKRLDWMESSNSHRLI